MTTYQKEGKDVIIFATAEDHREPSKVILPEPEPQPGLILPNGEINWNCPCLGGMATGPCGVEFREAFSCFHNSEADPKGSDCYDAFKEMHLCMAEYPALYNKYDNDKDGDIDLDEEGNIPDDDNAALDKKIETKIKERTESQSKELKAKDSGASKSKTIEDAKSEKKNVTPEVLAGLEPEKKVYGE